MVGAGVMGGAIASLMAEKGIDARLRDLDRDQLDAALHEHEREIRALAVARNVPCFTTIPAAAAAVSAIDHLLSRPLNVEALQDVLRGVTAG